VLLGWGLGDAAPFVFFSTEEEVALREQGEDRMLIATTVLLLAGLVLFLSGARLHALLVAAPGVATTGLLFSPLGGSVAPHVAFLLLVPAAAAALLHASGLTSFVGFRIESRSELKPLVVGLAMLAALYGFVLATGPVGALGALVAPLVFILALRRLHRSGL